MSLTIGCLGSVYSGSHPDHVKLAIDSLLYGSRKPNEIVLFIDGPISVELEHLLIDYTELHIISVIRSSINSGLGLALFTGLKHCTTDIVCRFDTDDINRFDRLECIQHAFDADHCLDIFFSSVLEFQEDLNHYCRYRIKSVPNLDDDVKRSLVFRNVVNHPSVAFKRQSIISIGSYRHQPFFEDYDLWLRAKKNHLKFYGCAKSLVYMRCSDISSRRSGLYYLKAETRFAFRSITSRLLPLWAAPVFLLRCLIRTTPGFYHLIRWFGPWQYCTIFELVSSTQADNTICSET